MDKRNTTTRTWKTALALLGSLMLASPALAVDGVLEINQAKIQATTGFPFSISQSGSYRLTGDLDLPDANTTGILVQVPFVTIDLNGFAIRCSSCSGSGTGDGIFADVFYPGVSIRNGTIAGVGNRGVALAGFMAQVDRVRVVAAGGTGIELGDRALVTRSHSVGNARGLRVGRGSAILDTNASQNLGEGMSLDPFGLVAGVVANENQGRGIFSTEGSVIVDTTANMNGGRGISTQEAVVSRVGIKGNLSDGIECSQCLISRSIAIDNDGREISGFITGLAENVIRGSMAVEVTGSVELGGNICNSGVSCP